jgi:hypothetical protein
MKENEVLEKLAFYKDAILKLKAERDEAKQEAAKVPELEKKVQAFETLLKDKDYLVSKIQEFGLSISDEECIQKLKDELADKELAYNSLLVQFNTLKTQLDKANTEFKEPLEKELQEMNNLLTKNN